MKTITITLLCLFLLYNADGQQIPTSSELKESLLLKSKKQRKTGTTLLIGGPAMALVGAALFSGSSSYSTSDIGGFMFLGGILATVSSIPFFISAGNNKSKAAELSLNYMNQPVQMTSTAIRRPVPQMTLKINLKAK